MVNEQPEALRLADALEKQSGIYQAADELRRLHEVNLQLSDAHLKQGFTIAALFEERDDLLAALKIMVDNFGLTPSDKVLGLGEARAAIAKATGEQT